MYQSKNLPIIFLQPISKVSAPEIIVMCAIMVLTHHIHIDGSISSAAQSISHITCVSARVHRMQSMPGHTPCCLSPHEAVVGAGGRPGVGKTIHHSFHPAGQGYGAPSTVVGRIQGEVRGFGVAYINGDS